MSYFEVGSANWRVLYEAITFCAAGFGILSVWAVLSWRHWFARGAVLAIAIAALLPIRAYEPVVLFLVSAPLTVVVLMVIRHCNGFTVIHESSIQDKRKTGFQVIGFTYAVIAVDLTLTLVGSKAGNWDPGSARPSWYEWVAFGSLVVAPSAVLAILRRIELSEEERKLRLTISAAKSARFRFGMLDLFLGMIIVGIASGIVGSIWRTRLMMDWLGMFGSAVCLTLIVVTAACFVSLRARWIALMLLVVAIVASTALHTWVFPDWTGAEVFVASWNKEWLPIFKIFLFAFSLLAVTTVIATYLLLVAGSFTKSVEHRSDTDRVSRSALCGLGCLVVSVYFPLAVVYWQMMAKLPVPESSPSDSSGYQQILATIGKLQQLNPQELTTVEIRDRQSDPEKADSIVQAYRALIAALKIPTSVSLDMKKAGRADYIAELLPVIQMLRGVARSLDRESGALEALGNYDEAAELGLANVRLGAIEQRGSILVESLVGIAIEGIGVRQVGRIRQNLSPDTVVQLISELEAIDQNRELSEITVSREAAWSDEAYKWRTALLREGPRVLASAERTGFEHLSSARAFESAARRRDALLRLLLTELTIRAYQIAEGRLPESLNDLCPRYFSSVPVDPFSGAALIYRRVDDTYVLYSVGLDQKDNGGKFGTMSDLYGSGGFDLNLDILD